LSDRGLALLVETMEMMAFRDLVLLPERLRERFDTAHFAAGGANCFMTRRLDYPLTNRVIGLGLTEPATEALVDQIVGRYKEAGNAFMVPLSPAAEPAELVRWLEERGLKRGASWVKMYRSTEAPVEPARTDLRIERATPEEVKAMAVVLNEAFGATGHVADFFLAVTEVQLYLPDWHWYIGWDGDTPVAVASMRIAGQVAGFYSGATLKSHRGRGGQSAMFERRLRDAKAAGCRWVVTETGEEKPGEVNHSYRNMLRAGFQLAYARPNYLWRPAPAI
jgi:GNAT superfamily N-acetyltransferase